MPETGQPVQPWAPRRIGIIGAGVMGSSLAAITGSAAPVVMVCRQQGVADLIKARGVRTSGLLRAASRPEVVRSIADLRHCGGISVLFVATKTGAIPEVAAELRPVLDSIGDQPGDPFIVSYQNGIEPGRQLIEMLGDRRVLRMVLTFGGRACDHGHIDVTLNQPPHSIGCLYPEHEAVCRALAAFLTRANFATRFDEDIERPVWAKGIINAAMNPVAALLDMQVGQVLDSPSEGIVSALMREGLAVATARGIELDEGFLDYGREVLERGRRHTPSMVQDIRAGRPSEVGQLNRQIVEHGRRLGVPTPTHDVILALIEGFDWKLYRRDEHIPLDGRSGNVLEDAGPLSRRLLFKSA